MADMKYHALTAALLAAAVALETAGISGATPLLAAGVGCEIAFWMRLVSRRF
jgi:hypothetical protein